MGTSNNRLFGRVGDLGGSLNTVRSEFHAFVSAMFFNRFSFCPPFGHTSPLASDQAGAGAPGMPVS
ncbi:hypothetical protein GGD89_002957 [Roseospira visakhapatnamensis]|uniref:Uncharacterized protein n=1 Tax=Roseospira visakhapatnamensis TaxID=390880 RepID=A0A7W6RG07_9PROT|nr:hypothetical protein [Roseospira visakhapatnamensis]